VGQNEGKGEFVAYLTNKLNQAGKLGAVVRTGGPNAGHTMTINKGGDGHMSDCATYNEPAMGNGPCNCDRYDPIDTYKMRQIPCAWHLEPKVPLYIAHGSLIDPEVLTSELQMIKDVMREGHAELPFITIDRSAIVITDIHKAMESHLRGKIGSTTEGIGAARSAHVMRQDVLMRKGEGMGLKDLYRNLYIDANVSAALNNIVTGKEGNGCTDIVIESTQGFDLSLNLSGHYPFTTSRDITPGQILSDCGLSSRLQHRVIAVVRTHPIRVAGNSGYIKNETDWEKLKEESGGYIAEAETTTVTGNKRRIGYYDPEQVKRMGTVCKPDHIALTFLDYLDPRCAGLLGLDLNDHFDLGYVTGEDNKVRELLAFIDQVEIDSGAQVNWGSTGPGVITDFFDRETKAQFGFAPNISPQSARAQREVGRGK